MNPYEWFIHTKEMQGLGFNLLTLSSFVIFALAILDVWGVHKQTQLIAKNKGADGLDLPYLIFASGFYAYNMAYGITIAGLTITAAGFLRTIAFLPLLQQAYKHTAVTATDRVTGIVCFTALLGCTASPWLAEGFLVFSIFSVLFLARLPLALYRLKKNKGTGDISGSFMATRTTLFLFWLCYSLVMQDTILITLATLYCLVWTTMVILWLQRKQWVNG